jgi:hypothetical protein
MTTVQIQYTRDYAQMIATRLSFSQTRALFYNNCRSMVATDVLHDFLLGATSDIRRFHKVFPEKGGIRKGATRFVMERLYELTGYNEKDLFLIGKALINKAEITTNEVAV